MRRFRYFRWLRTAISRLYTPFKTGSCSSEHECSAASKGADGAPAQGEPTFGLGPPAGNQPDAANLLYRRMEILHLDPQRLAETEPATLSKLQELCMRCKSRGACALELAHPSADAAWAEWREYCPNQSKLNELRVRSAARSVPKFLQ